MITLDIRLVRWTFPSMQSSNMTNVNCEKVDHEIAEGRLWRAKEILQGRISSDITYDAHLLRRYGEVLLAMGDDLEAGKMLFSSGEREPAFVKYIELFLARHRRDSVSQFWSQLPRTLKRQSHLKDFILSDEFQKSGWNAEMRGGITKLEPKPLREKGKVSSRIQTAIQLLPVYLFFVALTTIFVIGSVTTINYTFTNIFKLFK